MGRRALEVLLLNVACAFLSCHADMADYEMEVKPTPQATSFLQRTTSAQSVSPYQITSSSHAVTTLFSRRTSNIITTPFSQRTSVLTGTQTTNHHPVTNASAPNMTTQARANSSQLTSQTTHVRVTTTAPTSKKTTIQRTEKTTLSTNQPTHSRAATTAVAKTTTAKTTAATNQTTTLAVTTAARTSKTPVKTTVGPTTRTTHTAAKTTARTNVTTIHPENQTTAPTPTATVEPTLAPNPSSPPTGAYSVSTGSVNCIKVLTGLELIVQDSKTQKKGFFNIDSNITQTSGICGNLQSNLNITFNGGFISFIFVKEDSIYYINTVEASLKIPSAGPAGSWHNVTKKQLFTTTMGNSFKCLSKQTVNLGENFQLLTVNTQLQAFAIVDNQFGKVEECSADYNAVFPVIGLFLIIIASVTVLFFYVAHLKRKSSAYQRI